MACRDKDDDEGTFTFFAHRVEIERACVLCGQFRRRGHVHWAKVKKGGRNFFTSKRDRARPKSGESNEGPDDLVVPKRQDLKRDRSLSLSLSLFPSLSLSLSLFLILHPFMLFLFSL